MNNNQVEINEQDQGNIHQGEIIVNTEQPLQTWPNQSNDIVDLEEDARMTKSIMSFLRYFFLVHPNFMGTNQKFKGWFNSIVLVFLLQELLLYWL